jgi:hypothetical protein
MESACVSVFGGESESVANTVKLAVPEIVGVPEIIPPTLRDNPVGVEPEDTDQV